MIRSCTILILVDDLYSLSSLDAALILLLLLVVGNGHVALQDERVTDLVDLRLTFRRLGLPTVQNICIKQGNPPVGIKNS